MEAAAHYLMVGSLVATVAMVIAVLWLRAVIAARFLDEEEFGQFKEKGMMGTPFNTPWEMMWEYRFVLGVLGRSGRASAGRFAFAWKWCCRGFLAAVFASIVTSVLATVPV